MFQISFKTKKMITMSVVLVLAAVLLAGCGIHININKKTPNVEDMLAEKALASEPVEYNADGKYTVTFRYDKGGFTKMDLSQAYVAYYPFTILDQIDTITGGESDDIPPLPIDVQNSVDGVTGANELKKIAVITVRTMDDNTLSVSFTDHDNPVNGIEYFFIIPNEGIAGSVIPE